MNLHKFTLIFIVILSVACKQSNKVADIEEIPEVPVIQVVKKDTLLKTAYVANIKAIRNTELRSRVHGFLEKVLVDEGKYVKAGQALFQLSSGEYRIGIAKAEAALASAVAESKTAELEMERVGILVDKNVVTKTERDLSKAKLQVAQAKINEAKASLEEANLKMEYTTIRAPFSGMINRIPLRLGSLIEEGTLLTTLSDVSQVYTYFNVSETDYLRFTSEQKSDSAMRMSSVELILSDGSLFSEKGVVETMEGEFDESTGAIAFRARFRNPKGVLKHGATGKVVITTHEHDALIIPQKAVFEIQDRYFVFIVNEAGKIMQRAFVPGQRMGQAYIVLSGLKEGETIVFEGTQNLRDGNVIKQRQVAPEAAIEVVSK